MNTNNSKNAKVPAFIIPEEMKNINLSKESLMPMEQGTDFISLMQKFKEILNNKDSDWTLKIAVINYLRRIYKYEKQIFSQFFYGAKLYQKIIELIDSVRSSLSKNALTLLLEIFSGEMPAEEDKSNTNSLITVIKATIPHLISIINSKNIFIKNESKMCLEALIKNMKYFEVLSSLMHLMTTKKNKDAEICVELSVKMVKNLGKEFLVKNNQFSELMKYVVSFYEAQKTGNLKKCKDLLNCFIEVMGREEFDKKMEKCTKKEKENVKVILESKVEEVKKKTVPTSSLHFRKEIRERKKSLIISKPNKIKANRSVIIMLMHKGKDSMAIIPKTLKLNDENVAKNN
jgi:hypothetical protein